MNQERFQDIRRNAADFPTRLCSARRGFTLVELLMVIVVISVLSALLITASMSFLGTSRAAATKATLSKINTLLKQRMAAFEVQLDNDYTSGKHKLPSEVAGKDERLQKVFYRKLLFKKYFPQTWKEAETAGILSASDVQTTTSTAGVEAESESAEVLFAVLTKTSITGQGEVGQDAFLASELADKDGDGRKELVDSWGNPLRFYRWPCRLVKPTAASSDMPTPWGNPTSAQITAARTQIPALTSNVADPTLNSDPDNPLGIDLVSGLNTTNFLNDYHIPRTYHTPLVVSAGVDTLFGLESPVDPSNADFRQAFPDYQTSINASDPTAEIERQRSELYDNLTNLNALAGGTQ